jgi:protein-tyrosine-phosphatase
MKYKIIYVCYANKGRSPAFEAYTKDFLRQKSIDDVMVMSAGIGLKFIEKLRKENHALPSRVTRQILKSQSLSIDDHLINYLGDIIKGSDLILSVDQHTLEMINDDFPRYSERVMLVGVYGGSKKYKEVFGPHHSGRGPIKSEYEGYKRMIAEVRYVSRRIVKRFIKEREEGTLSRRKPR